MNGDVIVIFLQLILFANTAAFFRSLLRVSHTHFEKVTAVRKLARDGVASKRSIAYAIRDLFQDTISPDLVPGKGKPKSVGSGL